MTKVIVIIIVVLMVGFAGVLYGTRIPTDEEEALTAEEAYAGQFPTPVPEITMDTVIAVPLY